MHANALFCHVVADLYEDGDVVWCHDYHGLLLPKMLKEMHPSVKRFLFSLCGFYTDKRKFKVKGPGCRDWGPFA